MKANVQSRQCRLLLQNVSEQAEFLWRFFFGCTKHKLKSSENSDHAVIDFGWWKGATFSFLEKSGKLTKFCSQLQIFKFYTKSFSHFFHKLILRVTFDLLQCLKKLLIFEESTYKTNCCSYPLHKNASKTFVFKVKSFLEVKIIKKLYL